MADIALDSHPEFLPDYLADWARYSTATPAEYQAREDYAKREIKRMIDAGVAPLYAALSAPLADQQDAGVRALAALGHSSVTVRLREGVEPHPADPQGRILKGEDKGKLRAKIGNLPFASTAQRAEASARGQDMYATVDVGREPVSLSLAAAVLVWRQWGYRYRAEEERAGRSQWLVLQVRPDGKPFGVAPQPDKTTQGRR